MTAIDPGARLRALAKIGAAHLHDYAYTHGPSNGHVEHNGLGNSRFTECPHPDCALVRDGGVPQPETKANFKRVVLNTDRVIHRPSGAEVSHDGFSPTCPYCRVMVERMFKAVSTEQPKPKFPPVQLQDGKSPEWTCQECGGDALFCGCKPAFEIEARPGGVEPPPDWKLVPRVSDARRNQPPFDRPAWGWAQSLVHADFNPSGVVEMYWQDDQGWIAAIWNPEQDCWDAKVVTPTHWRLMQGPDEKEAHRQWLEGPHPSARGAVEPPLLDRVIEIFNKWRTLDAVVARYPEAELFVRELQKLNWGAVAPPAPEPSESFVRHIVRGVNARSADYKSQLEYVAEALRGAHPSPPPADREEPRTP